MVIMTFQKSILSIYIKKAVKDKVMIFIKKQVYARLKENKVNFILG